MDNSYLSYTASFLSLLTMSFLYKYWFSKESSFLIFSSRLKSSSNWSMVLFWVKLLLDLIQGGYFKYWYYCLILVMRGDYNCNLGLFISESKSLSLIWSEMELRAEEGILRWTGYLFFNEKVDLDRYIISGVFYLHHSSS